MKKALVFVVGVSALDTVASRSLRYDHDYNLLINGDFEQNKCPREQQWCIYHTNTPDAVTGWIADPDIEVGYGTVYNKRLGGGDRVVELAPNSNSCIRQKVDNLQPSFYKLEVIYAAR